MNVQNVKKHLEEHFKAYGELTPISFHLVQEKHLKQFMFEPEILIQIPLEGLGMTYLMDTNRFFSVHHSESMVRIVVGKTDLAAYLYEKYDAPIKYLNNEDVGKLLGMERYPTNLKEIDTVVLVKLLMDKEIVEEVRFAALNLVIGD